MELGKSTEQEIKNMYSLKKEGINKYSNGNQYYINPSELNLSDLKSTLIIFNEKNILVGVSSVLPKKSGKFKYLYNILNSKYKLVKEEIPFVGDKFAKFKDGKSEIILDAPHLGFQIYLDYLHSNFIDAVNKAKLEKEKQRRQNDASVL
ncbi:hypothetical protein KB562_00310 [Pasteurella atlantica]|nr:hypothetical protein [Pasteurella atlantica]QVE21848.1 hypothetical protein KGI96_03695 [Pasteurella atlantica]